MTPPPKKSASLLAIFHYKKNVINTYSLLFLQKYLHHPFLPLPLFRFISLSNHFIHDPQLPLPIPRPQLNYVLQLCIPIDSLSPPPILLFFKYYIIEPMYYDFPFLLLPINNIIIHTITKNIYLLWMWKLLQNFSNNQLSLPFFVFLPLQFTTPPPCPWYSPLTYPSSAPPYHIKALHPLPPQVCGLSLPLIVTASYPSLYPSYKI